VRNFAKERQMVQEFPARCCFVATAPCKNHFIRYGSNKKISDTKVTHFKELAFFTCLYWSNFRKPVEIKRTKHVRKLQV